MSAQSLARLPDGPLDIVGDIHGEIDALEALRDRLGYDADGCHPDGRRLVFVGDLIDRGPDSPAVLRAVIRMVEAGGACCIVGNHELNALRDDPTRHRSGEGWWYRREEPDFPSTPVDETEKHERFLPFLRRMPLALERDDLRVVHACWDEDAVASARTDRTVLEQFREHEERVAGELETLLEDAKQAVREAGLAGVDRKRRHPPYPYVKELARFEERRQNANPVKVLTSGPEADAGGSYYVGRKWRVVDRVRWWERYDGKPVIVGHYWRRYAPVTSRSPHHDLFPNVGPQEWLGAAARVMCIDYSVGRRFEERVAGHDQPSVYCLAALRVPEWQLRFDDRRPDLDVGPPGR